MYTKHIEYFMLIKEVLEKYQLSPQQLKEAVESHLNSKAAKLEQNIHDKNQNQSSVSSSNGGMINMNTNNNMINLNFNLNYQQNS